MRLTTRIQYATPPNIDAIVARFGAQAPGTVYAYGNVIYVPGGAPKVGSLHVPPGAEIPHHLIVHEEVHFDQQDAVGGPESWWNRYLLDDAFRLEQEVEAYRAQLAAVPNRAERRRLGARVVKDLSGPMYGRIVSKEQARALLSAKPDALILRRLASRS